VIFAKRFPFRLQVTAKEFFYTLSSRHAPPGAAVIQFVNYGEDPHDLRVQRVGGGRVYKTPVMQPGQYVDLSIQLVPGHYHLWCSIANHRQLGMQAVLVVS
jgi:plastocyanin